METPPGSTDTLDDSTAASPSFTPDKSGIYKLILIVNNGAKDSAPAIHQIKVSDKGVT
ncbi:MAG: hypothetical protein QMD61_00820 [Methanobacterium sp.]|nr:hypothetical protein [Methanobacterium sp.]